MRVLVSGAGIAGLTLAYWLRRFGYVPTLVERAPSLPTGGYKIDVRGTALEILKRMDVYEAVVAGAADMQEALLVDRDGHVINRMSGDQHGHRVGEDVEIVRGTLCRILMDRVAGAEFIFGDEIQAVSQSGDSVQVQFAKNGAREFALVIGADGIHSNLRQLAFGDESRFLRDLGLYLCVYSVPNYLDLDRLEIQYTELGRMAAIWHSRKDSDLKACFAFARSSAGIDLRDRAQQQQALRTVYADIGWEVPRLLDRMEQATDWYFDTAAQICMESWSQGRIALLGDAAFCASPMSGQGTSLALIGAYVLAGELAAASGNHRKAFAEYEREMRPFVEANQALGMRAANLMRSNQKKTLGAWLLVQSMRLIPGRMTEFFIGRSTQRIANVANAMALKDY